MKILDIKPIATHSGLGIVAHNPRGTKEVLIDITKPCAEHGKTDFMRHGVTICRRYAPLDCSANSLIRDLMESDNPSRLLKLKADEPEQRCTPRKRVHSIAGALLLVED